MMNMKKWFYGILIFLTFLTISFVSFNYAFKSPEDTSIIKRDFCYYEEDTRYVLVEKNNISNITSYLYKDNNNQYLSKIYEDDQEITLNNLIKAEMLEEFNHKIEELLYLKYPKFIADKLILDTVTKSYILREDELVIYYNNYVIEPTIDEILYLKVNYQEIKDYLNFTFLANKDYENESGYNYTNAKKAIAITFDDSPNGSKTTSILENLQNNKAHATFFVVGNKITPTGKDILINMKNLGNEIGSHTYEHANLYKKTDVEFLNDYNLMNDLYQSIFQEDFKLLRPPYGNIKNSQINLGNVSYILWSLDTNDWRYRNKNYLVNYVLNNVQDGDIILFHDSYKSTVDAITELLPLLYSKGYQVMSVSELFNLKGINLETNKVYHHAR